MKIKYFYENVVRALSLATFLLSTLTLISCETSPSSPIGTNKEPLSKNVGSYDANGYCSAEYSSCVLGDAGVSSNTSGGGGPAGGVDCGPQGQFWIPGTGCHEDSRCFQDLDNVRQAKALAVYGDECVDRGGQATVVLNTNGNGLLGARCKVSGGVPDQQNFPTTTECFANVTIPLLKAPNSNAGTKFSVVSGPFRNGVIIKTNDPVDEVLVNVELNAVPANEIQIVLNAENGITWRKEIFISEGAAIGTSNFTVTVMDNRRTDNNGLYTYQLPGAYLVFRKAKIFGILTDVLRMDISTMVPGSRVTFTWLKDT